MSSVLPGDAQLCVLTVRELRQILAERDPDADVVIDQGVGNEPVRIYAVGYPVPGDPVRIYPQARK